MKLTISLWLLLIIAALLGLSGFLLKRSSVYNQENRRLILENDSLMSVNIVLTNQLHALKQDSMTGGGKMSTALSE